MWNKPEIFDLKLMDITVRLITNKEGCQRYCVNQAEAARLLQVTAPSIGDKVSRGTIQSWASGDKKWIPVDIILPELDRRNITEDFRILIESGVFNYDPVLACIEKLLKTKKISWGDLDVEAQKVFLQKN